MEPLPSNPMEAAGQKNNMAANGFISSPVKKGRFGLPPDPTLAQKISETTTNAPNTRIKEEGNPILFTGEKVPQDAKLKEIFSNKGKEEKKQPSHFDELAAHGNRLNGLNGKAAIANIQDAAEARKAKLDEIYSSVKAGKAKIASVDHQNKTINFSKLDKKTDLTQTKNSFILAGNNVVSLGTNDLPANFQQYQFVTDDKSLQKDLETLKSQFVNGEVFIATSDEIRLLNQLNQNRVEMQENKKSDDAPPQDIKQKRESTTGQTTAAQPKVNEQQTKRPSVAIERGKTAFEIDQEKTEKAKQLKRDEEAREKKRELAHEADIRNEENIDNRVLNRLKQKNN